MNKLSLFISLFSVIAIQGAIAQQYVPSKGTEFWCAFPENQSGDCQQGFRIYADSTTNGTVEVPGQGVSIPFSVAAGGWAEVLLPNCQTNLGSANIAQTGIRISADDSLRVEAYLYQNNSSESAILLPQYLLEWKYMATMQGGTSSTQLSEIVVLATLDGSEIQITPTADVIGGFAAGAPFTILLNEGETMQLQSTGDLTGTLLQSTDGRPFLVFEGNNEAEVGNCLGAEGHYLFEQAQPRSEFGGGRHYFAMPFAGQDSFLIKITAFEDSTLFGFQCNYDSTMILNKGEFIVKMLDTAALISSNKPITVAQFSTSLTCHTNVPGEAAMIQLPAANRQSLRTVFTTPTAIDSTTGLLFFQYHFVNIVAQGLDTAFIWVDSVDIGGQFTPFSNGPDLWAAQVQVQPGDHAIWGEGGALFQATTYGFGVQDAYAHSFGFDVYLRDCIGAGVCLPDETEICIGDTLDFSHCASDLTGCLWHFQNDQDTTISGPTPTYVFNEPGEFEVFFIGTKANGCDFFSTSVIITVDSCCDTTQIPEIVFDTTNLCIDSTFEFSLANGIVPDSLFWVIGSDTFPGQLQIEWIFDSVGEYVVEAIFIQNEYCSTSDTVHVNVKRCRNTNCLHWPNAFSPNDDAMNDDFMPVKQCNVSDYSLRVYNRWGKLVFQSDDPTEGWDGGGHSSDVYIYMVEYLEDQTNKVKKKGDLTLLR